MRRLPAGGAGYPRPGRFAAPPVRGIGQSVSLSAPASQCDDALAYVVLERARLVCEHAERESTSSLRVAHRHLGRAGFKASDHLDEEDRLALLDGARGAAAGGTLPPAEEAGEEALLLARHAADIVARCLRADPSDSEQLQAAHVLDSIDALVTRVGLRRARSLDDLAWRMGQFDPAWQRGNLAGARASALSQSA